MACPCVRHAMGSHTDLTRVRTAARTPIACPPVSPHDQVGPNSSESHQNHRTCLVNGASGDSRRALGALSGPARVSAVPSADRHERKVAPSTWTLDRPHRNGRPPTSDLAAIGGRASVRRGCTYVAQKPRTALTWENFPSSERLSQSGANGIRIRGPRLFRLTLSPLVKGTLTRGFVHPLAVYGCVRGRADMSPFGLLRCPYVARREAQG